MQTFPEPRCKLILQVGEKWEYQKVSGAAYVTTRTWDDGHTQFSLGPYDRAIWAALTLEDGWVTLHLKYIGNDSTHRTCGIGLTKPKPLSRFFGLWKVPQETKDPVIKFTVGNNLSRIQSTSCQIGHIDRWASLLIPELRALTIRSWTPGHELYLESLALILADAVLSIHQWRAPRVEEVPATLEPLQPTVLELV